LHRTSVSSYIFAAGVGHAPSCNHVATNIVKLLLQHDDIPDRVIDNESSSELFGRGSRLISQEKNHSMKTIVQMAKSAARLLVCKKKKKKEKKNRLLA
jgi:hypothetical protein